MARWASIEDLETLWRPLTDDEKNRAEALIQLVEDVLQEEAIRFGKCLNDNVASAKSVIVDVVARTLMTSTNQEPMSQMSQSAGGYTVSGTFLVPGGGLFIKKSELARLGLRRQQIGVINFYG